MTHHLANSILFQDDAIISKTLVKNSGGTITLFAFDKGQALSEHTTPFEAFFFVVEGSAKVTINKVDHLVNTGEYILLPANLPHAVLAESKVKFLLTMIKQL
ncbi:MAG: cupin domain-containing protein [Bacteroidota bacterium]|nr:cupin domain-containing protein [Bacteroidota bacterium]